MLGNPAIFGLSDIESRLSLEWDKHADIEDPTLSPLPKFDEPSFTRKK